MLENSPAGLVMLDAEVTVTVTREEHHQQALSRYAVAPGMQRQVAVELTWCTITTGKYRGQRAIEVRLDGARVGELTHLMSHRYAPLVAQVAARGARTGCEALIQQGPRGLEVLLRLPRNGNTVIPLPVPPVVSQPVPIPPPGVAPPVAARRGSAPKWIAAGVVGVIFVAALVGSLDDEAPAPAAQLSSTTYSPPTTTTTTTTSSSSTTTPPTTTTTTTTVEPPAPPQQPAPPPQTKTQTPAPQPPQPPAPAPPPAQNCNPNYSGCVPNASDVDCAGGSGNGPAYVSGPIRVIGTDVYGLDNDKDGTACE